MQVVKYVFQPHGDDRGQLVALEELKDIPFKIKRVYYMYDTTSGVSRGHHAHKKTEQVLICVNGSCKIQLDDGHNVEEVELDSPTKGLYVGPKMWHSMYDFTEGSVLMVVASEYYDENDYIRQYNEFLEYITNDGE